MTAPAPYQWLATDDVVAWLKLAPIMTDEVEANILDLAITAAQPWVRRYRPDGFDLTDPAAPQCVDDEVYLAAIQQAGVLYLTRNSPVGVEAFTATVSYVNSVQVQIQRALRIGSQTQLPRVDRAPLPPAVLP